MPSTSVLLNGLGAHSISPPDESPSERGMEIIRDYYEANVPSFAEKKAGIVVSFWCFESVCIHGVVVRFLVF